MIFLPLQNFIIIDGASKGVRMNKNYNDGYVEAVKINLHLWENS
jgi:hypothetical protein